MRIYFATHSTTRDNETGIASGHNDVGLSAFGRKQAAELPERLHDIAFDIVFTSSLKRSVDTAKIAFNDKYPTISDPRLDELNLGIYNGAGAEVVHPLRLQHISEPFPRGESYRQRLGMMREFLEELKGKYPDKSILIVGHRATQWSLDVLLKGYTLEEVIPKPFHWQPYWEYNPSLYPRFFAGGFLYDPNAKNILLHKRDAQAEINPNKWAFFGGLNEEAETPMQTFVRELREELGISLKPEEIIPLCDYFNPERHLRRYVFYVPSTLTKEEMVLGEGEDFEWFSLTDAFRLDLTTRTCQDLETFQKQVT